MQTEFSKGGTDLTAYIMTKNEEHCIARCVRALSWCPKIVVADTGSSDGTKEIAKSLGCEVIDVPFDGFGTTRNRILERITGLDCLLWRWWSLHPGVSKRGPRKLKILQLQPISPIDWPTFLVSLFCTPAGILTLDMLCYLRRAIIDTRTEEYTKALLHREK